MIGRAARMLKIQLSNPARPRLELRATAARPHRENQMNQPTRNAATAMAIQSVNVIQERDPDCIA
jgi:hypothetical protein